MKQTKEKMLPRYVAFLRGVSPMNAKMPELKHCFEAAGFSDVKTLLSSGNLAFSARASSESVFEHRAEAAMQEHLGKAFITFVRRASALQEILASDPYASFNVPTSAKRIVTFLRTEPTSIPIKLPLVQAGSTIFALAGREVYSAYIPGPSSSGFAALIERAFSKDITTRTLETVRRCAFV